MQDAIERKYQSSPHTTQGADITMKRLCIACVLATLDSHRDRRRNGGAAILLHLRRPRAMVPAQRGRDR